MRNNVLTYLEQTAARCPEKTAVASRDARYTFSQLRAAARRIGAAILAQGVTGEPVGVVAAREIETVACFLGVLYSGNYYVPLDPEMPAAKRQAIVDDAAFSVILGLPEAWPILTELTWSGAYLDPTDLPDAACSVPETGDDDPLYMIYTSGSTGKPKGVVKSHRAEISFIEAYCDTFAFTDEEVIGNQTPFFFDASAKDLYMMLKLGCTIEILPTPLFTLPPELIRYLNEKRVTFVSWVPTVLSLTAQLDTFSEVLPTTLRQVFFVGEVMPMKHLNTWRAALPEIRYVNLYGQSELAGICCWYEVRGTFDDAAVLPMGVPLKNCEIYLLDGEEVITAPGRVGEMFLVSDALATAYFRDPEKTARSFLTRDFGAGPVRCFKTGDLAQYDADGNLIFAARTDYQIKHMGHRIELGEIEAVAGALDGIARCCCLYHAEKRRIVLFCELSPDAALTPREVQVRLRPKLSQYMQPGRVVILDRLPLNANGKIDRQALKASLQTPARANG